jgi:hypothetical protein
LVRQSDFRICVLYRRPHVSYYQQVASTFTNKWHKSCENPRMVLS